MTTFRAGLSDFVSMNVESAIDDARNMAVTQKAAVEIYETESRTLVAKVLPNGRVDVTFGGSQYISTWNPMPDDQ
jgi:hypothetical protein